MNAYPKYALASSAYCALRKPFVVANHKVESKKSTYSEPLYRNLLYTELSCLCLMGGLMGQILAPLHLWQDIQSLEIAVRGLNDETYGKCHYEHRDFISLLLY